MTERPRQIKSFRRESWRNVRQAFTLIEAVVSIVVVSIVATITIHYVLSATRLHATLSAQAAADSEVALAVNRMRRDIRVLGTPFTANSNSFSFVTETGDTNTFQLSGSELTLDARTLATDVQAFAVTYYDATNGMLSPLPLDGTNRALIQRVSITLSVTKLEHTSQVDLNFFYPREGKLKCLR